LFEQQEKAERLAYLCLDPRWPWPLTSVVFGLREKWTASTRRQNLPQKGGAARLSNGILNASHRCASIDHRADAEENHARLYVETGQRLAVPSWPNPAEVNGVVKETSLVADSDLTSWIDLLHEIMITLDVGNAVLSAWRTERMAQSDNTFGSTVLDTPSAVHNLGVSESFAIQNARANYWRPELGDKYIRHPRWGTYLRRAHLDRVGGLQRIRDTVPLAKVLELGGAGDLVYLQCTEHPSGALTSEGEQVRQALQDALAPIVAPPRPQEMVEGTKPAG
jgi:hypothetical protein